MLRRRDDKDKDFRSLRPYGVLREDLGSLETARFLRAVQSMFLQKRHLETADASTGSARRLYEPPLDMFGADAVERWFTEKEVEEVVEFANRMTTL